MRKLVLFLSLLAGLAALAATPAAACPEGYKPCGDFCCGAPPGVTP